MLTKSLKGWNVVDKCVINCIIVIKGFCEFAVEKHSNRYHLNCTLQHFTIVMQKTIMSRLEMLRLEMPRLEVSKLQLDCFHTACT